MLHSTRFKLVISFLIVSFLVGGVSLFIGGHLLYNSVIREATSQVGLALNAADDVYRTHMRFIKLALDITTLGQGFRTAFADRNVADLSERLGRLALHAELDFAGIVLSDGKTICRLTSGQAAEYHLKAENPITRHVLENRLPVAGTAVLSQTFMILENPELAGRLQFSPLPSGDGEELPVGEKKACLAIAAGIPLYATQNGGELLGVLYGGVVLNQRTNIVDLVQKSFFWDEIQAKAKLPTATIFFDTIRIATNMMDETGNRAIGTTVGDDVRQQVLIRGKQWTTRQYYLTERYIAAYSPIEDIDGRRIGMLSIAVSESNYSAIQHKFIFYFIVATAMGGLIAIGMGSFLAYRILGPIHRLIRASREVSEGNVSPDIGPISKDMEIAVLQRTFTEMVHSMKRRRMESRSQIIHSEKQATVGRLAAGVGHEINNPLTGVLTYTHMLLRRKDLPADIRTDLQVIAESTERVRKIVKGLLDFSRQTRLDPEESDINRVTEATIKLMENQALLKGVNIEFNPGQDLPLLVLDRSQIQSVLLNVLINALDATKPSDKITINTAAALSASDTGHRGVEITITDTGCGISPDHMNKLFDPFFSTKEVGKGTGLGLSVSYGIVKEHGGNIRVQSEVGRGSTFFIWLPIEKQVEEHENHGG